MKFEQIDNNRITQMKQFGVQLKVAPQKGLFMLYAKIEIN